MNGKFKSLFISVVIIWIVVLQSGTTNPVESPKSSAIMSLVDNTMSSTNDVPFDWASDYEVAVVYITSMWSEFEDSSDPNVVGIIAKNGFLNYCVRFKTKLAVWVKSLQEKSDVSKAVKKAVSSWYQAIDILSRDNWKLPEVLSLKSFKKQFRTLYKHLVINGSEVYETADSEKMKRDIDDFTRRIANMLVEILKEISKQLGDVPKNNDSNIMIVV